MTLLTFRSSLQSGFEVAVLALGFVLALCAALGLTPLSRRVARKTGIVDRPDGRRKQQKDAVPLLGGVAVCGGVALAASALSAASLLETAMPAIPLLLLSLGSICLVGIVDDVWTLPAGWKVLGQILSVLPILWAGAWVQTVGFFGLTVDVGSWGVALTIVWFIACINAVNLLDGMDGLASTVGLCIATGIAAIGVVTGADAAVLVAASTAGALGGFLFYNLPPATIYLGDAGSMAIGFLLALLTLQVGVDSAGRSSLTVMIVLMAVPFADVALAVVRRALNGQTIWHPDRGHIHHRLLDRGLRPTAVLRFVVMLCSLTGAIAVVSRILGWDVVAWCAGGALAVLLVRARLIGHHEWSLARRILGGRLYFGSFELPSPEQLNAMPFEAAWNLLAQMAPSGSLRRVQLAMQAAGDSRQHEWRATTPPDPREDRLAVELSLRLPESGHCRLRVEAAEPPVTAPGEWQFLVEAARYFAHHWVRRRSAAPAAGLRIYSDDKPAALESQNVATRRAA